MADKESEKCGSQKCLKLFRDEFLHLPSRLTRPMSPLVTRSPKELIDLNWMYDADKEDNSFSTSPQTANIFVVHQGPSGSEAILDGKSDGDDLDSDSISSDVTDDLLVESEILLDEDLHLDLGSLDPVSDEDEASRVVISVSKNVGANPDGSYIDGPESRFDAFDALKELNDLELDKFPQKLKEESKAYNFPFIVGTYSINKSPDKNSDKTVCEKQGSTSTPREKDEHMNKCEPVSDIGILEDVGFQDVVCDELEDELFIDGVSSSDVNTVEARSLSENAIDDGIDLELQNETKLKAPVLASSLPATPDIERFNAQDSGIISDGSNENLLSEIPEKTGDNASACSTVRLLMPKSINPSQFLPDVLVLSKEVLPDLKAEKLIITQIGRECDSEYSSGASTARVSLPEVLNVGELGLAQSLSLNPTGNLTFDMKYKPDSQEQESDAMSSCSSVRLALPREVAIQRMRSILLGAVDTTSAITQGFERYLFYYPGFALQYGY